MRTILLAVLLSLTLGCARAQTLPELTMQAEEPWRETISAYGREIQIDVTPVVPDTEHMGIYRVTTVDIQKVEGNSPVRETVRKKRGYAYRTKPSNVYDDAQSLDPDSRAYGNPLTTGEALGLAQGFAQSVQVQGVEIALEQITIHSPVYIFNKNTGEWGEQLYEDEVGTYHFKFGFALDGVTIRNSGNLWLDSSSYTFDEPQPQLPYWIGSAMIGEQDYRMYGMSAPSVLEQTTQDVQFAPLEATKASLRSLAERGLLRDVVSMELVYVGFDCGVGEVWELRPVWQCEVEIYYDAEADESDYGWNKNYSNVITDARTGEIVQKFWADGVEPGA